MARTSDSDFDLSDGNAQTHGNIIQANGQDVIDLPDSSFLANANIARDGADLILETPQGETLVIEGYFSATPAPLLNAPDGGVLTPDLVNSFAHNAGPLQYAQTATMNDASPVGAVEELSGQASVTHTDGTSEPLVLGMPIYQGDVIETSVDGAVNILFSDDSNFAVSENARLAIDEYVFDPASESGTSNFSLLRGVFVFTSGLIGRGDPDDVEIDTPVGSIGIRGTTLAGTINPDGESQITVTEGAIVVRNGTGEFTMSDQFETVSLSGFNSAIEPLGVVDSAVIANNYGGLQNVAPVFFTELGAQPAADQPQAPATAEQAPGEQPAAAEGQAPAPGEQPAPVEGQAPQGEPAPAPLPPVAGMDPGFEQAAGLEPALDGTLLDGLSPVLADNAGPLADAAPITADAGAPSATVSVEPPPLPPLAPEALPLSGLINGTAVAGNTVIVLKTTMDYAEVHFSVSNIPTDSVSNPYFTFVDLNPTNGTASLVLTAAGEEALTLGHITKQEVFDIQINVSLPNGRTATSTLGEAVANFNLGDNALNLNGISGADGYMIGGENAGNHFGSSIAALGDGRFIVTEDAADGASFVYNHAGTPINADTIAPSTNDTGANITAVGDYDADGDMDYVIGTPNAISTIGSYSGVVSGTGSSSGNFMGYSVAGIGDLDGDGYMDVVIGAPGANGITYIDNNSSGNDTGGTGFGHNVAAAGDFNNDGFADFLVSAPDSGSVSIYGGSAAGATLGGTITGVTVDTTSADPMDHDIPLVSLGDMNGDGISDFAVGHTGNDTIQFFWGSGAFNTGADFTISADAGQQILSAGAAGDFNGDGYDDAVVVVSDNTNPNKAHLFVVYGQDGLTNMGTHALYNPDNAFHMTYNLGGADPSTFNFEITSLGDMNGDGYEDLAIGMPDAAGGDGGVIVVNGRDTTDNSFLAADGNQMHIAGVTTGANVIANADNQHLVGNSGANNLNDGANGNVSMQAGAGNDVLAIHNTFGALGNIDGGAGIDRLQLFGTSNTLDFSTVGSEGLHGIERIELTNVGQTVTLGLDDIFRLLQESETGELWIDDTTDSANAQTLNIARNDGGATGGLSTIVSTSQLSDFSVGTSVGSFNCYDFGGYSLYVDSNIETVAVTT